MQRHSSIRSSPHKNRPDARKHKRDHVGASRILGWNEREYPDQAHLPRRRALWDGEPGLAPNDEKAEGDGAAQSPHDLRAPLPVLPGLPAPLLLPQPTGPGWERPSHPAGIRIFARQKAV